jgi:hypothetical protein
MFTGLDLSLNTFPLYAGYFFQTFAKVESGLFVVAFKSKSWPLGAHESIIYKD